MEFPPELEAECQRLLRYYPDKAGALLPILHCVQDALGQLVPDVVERIADLVAVEPARVRGVIEFYSAFRARPNAHCRIAVCRALSCRLVGAEEVLECLREHLGIGLGEATPDGSFAIEEVDCLGVCSTGPAMLVGGRLCQSLTREYIAQLLGGLD